MRHAFISLCIFAGPLFLGDGGSTRQASADAPPDSVGSPFLRAEFQNQSREAVASCSVTLLGRTGQPTRPRVYLVDGDEVGYGARVQSRWDDHVGYARGTTMLPRDPCDWHRTFVTPRPAPAFANGLRGLAWSIWLPGENSSVALCVTSAGPSAPGLGRCAISPAARDLAGALVRYEGLRCCCRKWTHAFEVRTWHYADLTGDQVERSWRWDVDADMTIPRHASRAMWDGGGRRPFGPDAGENAYTDGPGAPKEFSDFELRNGGNRRIRNASVKGHRAGAVSAFGALVLVAAGSAQQGAAISCRGAAESVCGGFQPSGYSGHETGAELDQQGAGDYCRGRYPTSASGAYVNVTALVYTIEIEMDAADPTRNHTINLCVTSRVPDLGCPEPGACTNMATCADGNLQYPLCHAVVEYQGYDATSGRHKFKVERGVFKGGASDMTVTNEVICCLWTP